MEFNHKRSLFPCSDWLSTVIWIKKIITEAKEPIPKLQLVITVAYREDQPRSRRESAAERCAKPRQVIASCQTPS